MTLTPGSEGVQGAAGVRAGAMEEVAEKDHQRARESRQQPVQALKVVRRRALRHRLAQAAIGRRLAKMRIGDQQALSRGPIDCLVRQQPQFFVCQRYRVISGHQFFSLSATFSRSLTIRAIRSESFSELRLSRKRS